MSTYAAVFVFDPMTEKYNGFSVKYDGYIENGVGETLYNFYYSHDLIIDFINKLNNRTDVAELGNTFEESRIFDNKDFKRYPRFKNLTYDEMLNEAGNYDYLYTMVPDDRIGWDWKVQANDGFHSLSEYF